MKEARLVTKLDGSSQVDLRNCTIGGKEILLIGGPCAVETPEQMQEAAKIVKQAGGKVLRGGIFKPRTSPYSFQGLGKEGLKHLIDAAREHELLTVTEVLDSDGLEQVAAEIDIIQIGARSMQNFQLLRLAGQSQKPVILKRGLAATIEEWLYAAEYILAEGNDQVILCERGIRTYETTTRSTLDLSAVGVIKSMSNLPVIVDPSHAAGRRDLVPALAKAAISAGADGLLIEMHPNPSVAMCDGEQSLYPTDFLKLSQELSRVSAAVGRIHHGTLPEAEKESLESLRKRIDTIDEQLVMLLAERISTIKKVAGEKSLSKIKDSAREQEVLHRVVSVAEETGCPADLVKSIYQVMFDHAVKLQFRVKTDPHQSRLNSLVD